MKQYAAIDDTIYFWFAANDTSGSGGDGSSPAADVRLAGAAADAAPVYSPTPSLLSHVNYPEEALQPYHSGIQQMVRIELLKP